MNISFYTARSGMLAQQQGMNIYANNIANINTVGYKPLRPSFAECIYTLQHPPREQWQTGHGQYLNKTDLMWEESPFVASDNPLHFALIGDGFFMTLDRHGDTYLTRDGTFGISFTGDRWELVNGFGDFVLDYDGNRITVPFELDGNGNVTTNIDFVALEAMIGVFAVPNNWGLTQAENNRFVVNDRSGAATADPNAIKINNALEMSGTDLAGDMVRIIETQRSYQLNARMVRISDEMMTTINSLR
jgi:flagellar basal-body rod protein FlgG